MNFSHSSSVCGLAHVLAGFAFIASVAGCDVFSSSPVAIVPQARPAADISLPETATDHWPGFRGVNGTGVSAADHLPVTWDDRLGVRWSAVVPGSGNSSPVIWDNSVFLTTADEGRECKLLCFDRADGSLRWQQSAGMATGRRHAKNGDASPTPVTDGQRVYAFFGEVGMICCDLDGNLLWKASLGEVDHPWGVASSPVLFDDLVIQLCDSESESSLIALYQATGEIAWRTPRTSTGCWSTPAIMAVGDGAEKSFSVVINGTGCEMTEEGYVIGYDPRTGQEQWRIQGTTDAGIPVPLVVGEMVVVASGRNGNTMLLRPATESTPMPADAHYRSTPTCEAMWVIPGSGPFVQTGVVYEGLLYQVGDQGVFCCYDAATSETIYEKRLPGNYTAGLIAGDGKIYATNEKGRTYVVQAGRTHKLLSKNDVHSQVLATPAVAGGDLFIRTDRQLLCIPAQAPEPASVNEAAPFEPAQQSSKSAQRDVSGTAAVN